MTVLVAGDALWATVSVAVRLPEADGVNVTAMVQLAAGAMLAPDVQVLLLTAKSAPEMVVAPSNRATVPELVSVTLCAADVVPTLVEAKVSWDADNDAPGEPAAAPVPVRDTELLDGVAL